MLDLQMSNISVNIRFVRCFSQTFWQFSQPCRPMDGFLYFIKGGLQFEFEDRRLQANVGDFVYLPAGAVYKNHKTVSETVFYQVDFEFRRDGEKVPFAKAPIVLGPEASEAMLPCFQRLLDSYITQAPAHSLLEMGLVFEMMSRLSQHLHEQQGRKTGAYRIQKTVAFLEEHYDEDTPLEELAAMSSTCVSNLEKIFKRSFGLSPVAYRNHLRVQHAKQLLLNGARVAETATKVGFANEFYFSRVFKNQTGQTPGEFARHNVMI